MLEERYGVKKKDMEIVGFDNFFIFFIITNCLDFNNWM